LLSPPAPAHCGPAVLALRLQRAEPGAKGRLEYAGPLGCHVYLNRDRALGLGPAVLAFASRVDFDLEAASNSQAVLDRSRSSRARTACLLVARLERLQVAHQYLVGHDGGGATILAPRGMMRPGSWSIIRATSSWTLLAPIPGPLCLPILTSVRSRSLLLASSK
jgi:hypothetical protein